MAQQGYEKLVGAITICPTRADKYTNSHLGPSEFTFYSNESCRYPSQQKKTTQMAISWEGNQEPALTTNAQGRRQRRGEDDVDLQHVDKGHVGR
jgi:hypothetical protein